MTLISGVLKGPYGDPRSGVTITMRAVRTSSTVLGLAKSQSVTNDSGKYSLSVEPGAYEVIISVYGAQPERVGAIEVYNDSLPGTLNDFLRRPGENDVTPEIVQTVDRLRAEAALSADKSAASAAAAKVSEQNAANSVKPVTSAGFGSGPIHRADVYAQENTSFINRFNAASVNAPIKDIGAVLALPMSGEPSCAYFAINATRGAWVGSSLGSVKTITWQYLWGESNTTVDANGFIKKASPIARLSAAPQHMQADYLDGGFDLAGYVAVNGEAAGVSAERIATGLYQLNGSLGLAKEGWTIEVPQDVNGNRLCFVETATDNDGVITVKISKRRFDIDTATVVAGEAMDIPEGRWIDLRLAMPVREEVEVLPPEALVLNDDTPSETNAVS
ncbi:MULTISPECIES: prophage tail fiber N-terminal domain-containing protein [unclassified Serratia (in: enterobacteria)]|uniref:phage tail fiber protein n=1 Tax=unclassified Serratia (in: enterobacteria) TaxID=2647522 RepID=UPI0015F3DAE2|nr:MULTISPECIES: prophage tail fiber N-terminal domain-containing protein [unclassified Serratia (in: enterobacteria)]